MPRPVVPMASGPRARSRAWSRTIWDGRMSGHCGEIRSRSNTGTPCSLSVWLSLSSASSDNMTPLPMKQRTCSRRIPEGMSNRMMTPTSMLPSPAIRNSRSRTSRSLANARFTPWGLRNGAMPSNTRNSPSAASRSVKLIGQQAARALTPRGSRFRRIFQILEEIPVGRHHQQDAILAERALVSLQAAIEGVELGVLRIGTRVCLGGDRVAFATHAQRIALRIREDHGALAFSGGADAGAGALALRAQAARGLGKALLHALVYARRHLVG